VLFQQPPGQPIPLLARPFLTLGKRDQAILAIAAKHLIERLPGLLLELATTFTQFFTGDSRHDRSSLIGI